MSLPVCNSLRNVQSIGGETVVSDSNGFAISVGGKPIKYSKYGIVSIGNEVAKYKAIEIRAFGRFERANYGRGGGCFQDCLTSIGDRVVVRRRSTHGGNRIIRIGNDDVVYN